MNRLASLLRLGLPPLLPVADESDVEKARHVAAIYHGHGSYHRVCEAFDWLNRNLGSEVELSYVAWSFDMLGRLDVRAAATRDTREANLLLVVVEGGCPLTDQVKRWIEECLSEERSKPLSVALLNSRLAAHRTVDAIAVELANLTRRLGAELFYASELESSFGCPPAERGPHELINPAANTFERQ